MNKTKILLIDDDKIVLRTIEKLLVKEGYEVSAVDNGEKAFNFSQNVFFDLIIADIKMPNIGGIETIKKIRRFQEASEIFKSRFMVITGYPDLDISKKLKQLNVHQFLTKPFDRDKFLETIKACLKKEPQEVELKDYTNNKELIDNFIREQGERNKYFILNKKLPVMGWYNTYVPEEIIIAAGFLPYRVMGAPISLSLSKAYLSGNLCPSVQSVLECALKGEYDFLGGIVICGATDVAKRLYDAWVRYIKTPFCHLFDIPKVINEYSLLHYMESERQLIEGFENHFKMKINNSKIKEAIIICNKTRELLNKLNDYRKKESQLITSQQFLEICKLAATGNKEDFNNSLEALLAHVQITFHEEKNHRFRVLLTGSFQDQPWLLDIIEEKGGLVVCEDLCTRLRYFSGLTEISIDPIRDIAKRYLEAKPASASLVSLDQRADYILKLAKEFNIDGVVYYILKFDDPYLFEFPDMKEILSSNGIPVLRIESEHNTSVIGQIMTRVQAFMETLKLAKARKANASITAIK